MRGAVSIALAFNQVSFVSSNHKFNSYFCYIFMKVHLIDVLDCMDSEVTF